AATDDERVRPPVRGNGVGASDLGNEAAAVVQVEELRGGCVFQVPGQCVVGDLRVHGVAGTHRRDLEDSAVPRRPGECGRYEKNRAGGQHCDAEEKPLPHPTDLDAGKVRFVCYNSSSEESDSPILSASASAVSCGPSPAPR